MKSELILGTLASLAVASAASPLVTRTDHITLTGDQLKGFRDLFNGGKTIGPLAPNQSINCQITYTLALSNTAPWTITLSSLDLSSCTFTPAP
ncbi:Uncharacterized protein PECH_005212 [Penicillium ucsense]|uniref:Uncharacterized protein n=1 Tax=Penicillium ucsense TaxID=2839758 RepID=A0A8J8W799_9EURO|nr:Uncharacterized protein PECM_006354 [Penicillium ucsense]KAF7736480.1 Uncharacterized protein PECH_005212 [Penicillium ucsense]